MILRKCMLAFLFVKIMRSELASKERRYDMNKNEGGLAYLPVRHPLGALDGGLTGGCFGNSSILGGHSSKADSYHFKPNRSWYTRRTNW